jgi:NitT/TauT family transport system permease protein
MSLVVAAFGFWLIAWFINQRLVAIPTGTNLALARAINLLVPVIFGVTIFVMWELIVRGLNVPTVLLPPPSMIGARFASSIPTLWADFQQTFLKAVLAGYVLGCGSGFIVASLIDRSPFLHR